MVQVRPGDLPPPRWLLIRLFERFNYISSSFLILNI